METKEYFDLTRTVEVETCVSIVVMKESTTSGCLNTRNSTLLARVR